MVFGELVNRMTSPPGNTWGQRWVDEPGRSFVTAFGGVAPVSGRRDRGPAAFNAATILWSSPQLAPRGLTEAHSATGVPPYTEIFFSLPSAKNPTHSPSGEKNA